MWISHRRLHAVWFYPGSTTATLCSSALYLASSTSCSEYRTTPQRSFMKHQDDHTRIYCLRNYTGCRWSSASLTSWPCWRSKYDRRQHRRTSVNTSQHGVELGHLDHRVFHCSMCPSDGLPSANDRSAALHRQPGTFCLLLSLTVTPSLYFNLGLKLTYSILHTDL